MAAERVYDEAAVAAMGQEAAKAVRMAADVSRRLRDLRPEQVELARQRRAWWLRAVNAEPHPTHAQIARACAVASAYVATELVVARKEAEAGYRLPKAKL